jgi:aconitate hydratase
MSTPPRRDPFGATADLATPAGNLRIHRLDRLESALGVSIARLPFSIRVLLEAALRHCDGFQVTEDDVRRLAGWKPDHDGTVEVPFKPARVILQDFTGVPCVVDLAAMRDAVERLGADAKRINPLVPVDLVIDHSVQVDVFGNVVALERNAEIEFARNRERYEFLRWGQQAFSSFRVVPPATGIVHQVNLEYLAQGVLTAKDAEGRLVAYPDSLVGTDSHTTMINGLGVVGWGVGGIEAEAVMLGQPLYLVMPRVVGFKLTGALREGVTATDLVLTATQMLRRKGVVDQFVEFYGPGLTSMSVADRATIGNMSPEYGATMGFFPIDAQTLLYLERTGRGEAALMVQAYARANALFRTDDTPDPEFSDTLTLDLGEVEPSLAGPKRPQDRVALREMKGGFRRSLTAPVKERGYGLPESELGRRVEVGSDGDRATLTHGSVVIAAITSCTNTSNPSVMVAAGLVARNARKRGLQVPPHVKTSLAPGSKVVTRYLTEAGLMEDLEALRFHTVGYGCTTCIGNSGPLPEPIAAGITGGNLVAASVLSGNRNFEGRINPHTRANYLASPPLVVAYALAGTVDIDLTSEPLGRGADGQPVYLRELWPSQKEIADTIAKALKPAQFEQEYGNVFDGNPRWNAIPVAGGESYRWDPESTYIHEPPFFQSFGLDLPPVKDVRGARVLVMVGDSVTTDHISPAGDIAEDSPAGRWLKSRGIQKRDFNSYGARRGNDLVMVRGTFANIRLKNLLVPGSEGNVTIHLPSGEKTSVFDAAERYRAEGTPLLVLAGTEYGTGSSRDWAAKGTLLLGVRVVLAESYERIHRSNLVGMGVLPLQYEPGSSAESLGLTGRETFDVTGLEAGLKPRMRVTVAARREDGATLNFPAIARLDTPVEVDYYRNGGILQTVLRKLVRA